MKLIISGGSGYISTQLIRQSLDLPQITSLVVLSRKSIKLPEHANAGKVKQVLVEEYDKYPDEVRKEFSGADACIWTVGITPGTAKNYEWDKVIHVCETCTLCGLQAMLESNPAKPFRFLLMSGDKTERDQTKAPGLIFGKFLLMRGEVENKVLSFAKENSEKMEVLIVKPPIVTGNDSVGGMVLGAAMKGLSSITSLIQYITLEEVSAAMLSQVIDGFKKETLGVEELQSVARDALKKFYPQP